MAQLGEDTILYRRALFILAKLKTLCIYVVHFYAEFYDPLIVHDP